MSIVDKINEKTGKFANNIAEAVADLLGHDLKATTIVENIGEGNNITEALDNLSGAQSANIAEAIDNYCGVEHTTTTIEEACEHLSVEPVTEETVFEFGSFNMGEYSDAHGLFWEYIEGKTVNEGDTLRVRIEGITGHVGSESETITDIDNTVVVGDGTYAATIDNYSLMTGVSGMEFGVSFEIDPNITPRYDGNIDINRILITKIPTDNSATPNFNSMTKAEVQAWADENSISGVDQNSQTKAEMIEIIEAALNS